MSKNKEEIKDETLDVRLQEIQQQEEALNAREAELNAREETLNVREETLQQKEAELVHSEGATEVVKEPQKGLEFEFRGAQYKFADDAPKSILFEGEVRTQEDLAKDEDALVILIGGHSPLIKRIEVSE